MTERFSASVAGRHMACHASANLPLAIPNYLPPLVDNTAAAQSGTDVHEIFEKVWELTASDMRHFIRVTEYVQALCSTRRFKKLIEHEMTATWLVGAPTTKADLVLFTQDEMHVIDTKWGKIEVPVFNNAQLKFYAATYGRLAPKAKGVTVHILQPRADNMDSVFLDTNEIAAFMKEAQDTEAAIAAGSLSFGPSDYCQFCPANPHSRGAKAQTLCPVMLELLYPNRIDEAAILADL